MHNAYTLLLSDINWWIHFYSKTEPINLRSAPIWINKKSESLNIVSIGSFIALRIVMIQMNVQQ